MIDLTPLEVRQKKGDFRRTVRGYDPELVNDFLDLVADRMEELVKENMLLRDSVGSTKEELTEYRRKEQALSDALMSAQKLREDARSHAEREGDLLLREARLAAEAIRQEATRQLAREEEALRQVRARRHQLVASFRQLLEREMRELEVIQETLELRGASDPQLSLDQSLGRAEGRGDEAAPTSAGPPPTEPAAAAGAEVPAAAEPDPGQLSDFEAMPELEALPELEGVPELEVQAGGQEAQSGARKDQEGGRKPGEAGAPEDEEAEGEQDDWLSSLMEE
jgi:cell division initiation protein